MDEPLIAAPVHDGMIMYGEPVVMGGPIDQPQDNMMMNPQDY